MRAKIAKKLRAEVKEHSGLLPWQSYEGMKASNGKQQIVLAECQKALYHELKKEYYRDKEK